MKYTAVILSLLLSIVLQLSNLAAEDIKQPFLIAFGFMPPTTTLVALLLSIFASCAPALALDAKKISVINSYMTKGIAGEKAAIGPDGNIWLAGMYGNTGCMTRLDPKVQKRVVSYCDLEFAIVKGILTRIDAPDGKFRCMVAGANCRLFCFDENGRLLKTLECYELLDFFKLQDRNLFFSSEAGILYELTDSLELLEMMNPVQTSEHELDVKPLIVSPSSFINTRKNPSLVFVTETRHNKDLFLTLSGFVLPETWSVVVAPLNSRKSHSFDIIFPGKAYAESHELSLLALEQLDQQLVARIKSLQREQRWEEGRSLVEEAGKLYPQAIRHQKNEVPNSQKVSRAPTVVPGEPEDAFLLVSEEGKIVKGTANGLASPVGLINLRCRPFTPIMPLPYNQFAVMGVEVGTNINDDMTIVRCVFTGEGKFISREAIKNFDGQPLKATYGIHHSKPAIFLDKKNRLNVMVGFEDGSLKIIDVLTGIVVGSRKFEDNIYPPQQLNDSDFFITIAPVFQLTKEAEQTQHYLVRVE